MTKQLFKKHVRLLHTADIHLGSFEGAQIVMEAVATTAVDASVDLVIIAGDLFDNNHVGDAIVESALEHLQRLRKPAVILPGNHDCLVADSVYNRAAFLEADSSIHVCRKAGGEEFLFPHLDLTIWGKAINGYGGNVRPLGDIPLSYSQGWRIAVAHGLFNSANTRINRSFPISMDEIVNSGMDYVALGHMSSHKSICETGTTAYYSGSVSQTGIVLIVDLAAGGGVSVQPHRALS